MERALAMHRKAQRSSSSSSSSSSKATSSSSSSSNKRKRATASRSRRSSRLKQNARGATGIIIDEETRLRVHKARLASLEDDNYEEEADSDDGAYVDDEDDDVFVAPSSRGRRGGRGKAKGRAGGKAAQKKTSSRVAKKRKVYKPDQLFHEDFNTPQLAARGPNWFLAAMGPPSHPARLFCIMCGQQSSYTCTLCGSRYCCARCNIQHRETKCLKFAT